LRPNRKRKIVLWILLLLFLAAGIWVATSSNPIAQGIQELGGNKHDQSVLEKPFSVPPRNFRYYKFTLPDGSTDVTLVGQFAVSSDKNSDGSDDAGKIELYVLSEAAFAIWQKGYAATSVYESGKLAQGQVKAPLPAGGGVYYLVFNNKFSTKTAKNMNATFVLRYKSWEPEWLRRWTRTEPD
jgi:hypothetical protein